MSETPEVSYRKHKICHTKVGLHGKPSTFVYFRDLLFMDYCLNFVWYSQKCWQKNLETLVLFMKCKIKKRNHLVLRVGPKPEGIRARFAIYRGFGGEKCPRTLGNRCFQFHIFLYFMKSPKIQIFCQQFLWPKSKQSWNQFQRKNWLVRLAQNTVYYQILNLKNYSSPLGVQWNQLGVQWNLWKLKWEPF